MPYAGENRVSTKPFSGAVQITQSQYQQALAGMAAGQRVTVQGGFALVPQGAASASPPPVEPPALTVEAWRLFASVTKASLAENLLHMEMLTAEEAEEFAAGGIPSALDDWINLLPEEHRAIARIRIRSHELDRSHELWSVLAAHPQGPSETEIDQAFGWIGD